MNFLILFFTANAGVSPMSMQNLVTLAAMTGGNGNLQVSPNSEYQFQVPSEYIN